MREGQAPEAIPPSPGPSLVGRTAELLEAGPLDTLSIARQVLGLRGHEGAAASAVYRLLGENPHFTVGKDGTWSLAKGPGARRGERGGLFSAPLASQAFAVVDVETAGAGSPTGGSIVEIAICEVARGTIVSEYQTLLNPGRPIPGFITSLTGITNEMLRGAPLFEHVADEVSERLAGRVFVAQNVNFDWRFVGAELLAANRELLNVPKLCTAATARRLFPALHRRNLDALAHHFGISIDGRHRAYPDALATARVLLRLLDEAMGRGIDDVATLLWYLRRRRRRRAVDARQLGLELRRHPRSAS